MQQVKMIAKIEFTYAEQALLPDQEFLASERDAVTLTLYGRAQKAEDAADKKRRYRRRDMQAEDTP